MQAPTRKPPVFAVCLTRQEIYVLRRAIEQYHVDHTLQHGAWRDSPEGYVSSERAAIVKARIKLFDAAD